jgi:hypothetical protein
MTYNDTSGDSGNGPDVSTIQVSNNDGGEIAFMTQFNNRPLLQGDDLVNILLDVDIDKEAGGPTGLNGIDYIFVADANGWGILKWNGSTFAEVPTFGSASYTNNVLTFEANLSDLGNPSVVAFVVLTTGDGSNVNDSAPDSLLPGGLAVFEVKIASTATPTLEGALTVGRAKAGTRFTATLQFARSDAADPTTEPLGGKTFFCTATVAGKPLRPTVRTSAGGVVRCAWPLPKKSAGKYVKGSVSVAFSSATWATVTKRFSKRIG